MIRKFFRRLRDEPEIQTGIEYSFSKIGEDLNLLRQWTAHVSSKGDILHRSHSQHIEVTQKELKNLSTWIEYLKNDVDNLKSVMRETNKYLIEAHKSHKKLYEKVADLEKRSDAKTETRTRQGLVEDMSGTTQRTSQSYFRTSQGQVRDKSEQQHPKDTKRTVAPPQIKIVNKRTLNPSQEEVLKVLYETDEPLDYKTLARIIRKKEKSIRNLVYELREKGVEIISKNIGFRKKGFYIPEEEKIRVSGR